MGFDIDSYRASFLGGARQYLFYYRPLFPGGIGGSTEKATYLVRSTQVPETTSEEIITNWQGFDFKFAGKPTYSDWTVTFNVDKDAEILRIFNSWARVIHDPTTNTYAEPSLYFMDQQLELLGLDGTPITKYKLVGAWPKSVGSASIDYSSSDVLQFDVNFTYLYHVTDNVTYGKNQSFS